ncbi:hypothetical protein [Nostoc sp.]|uniref:hypothetical protein n=1 Tax=Nostoc sp. TaxID=1180 RepID=UPI002FF67E15
MASIIISELRPAGIDLFHDSESFFSELTDADLDLTHGGMTPILAVSSAYCVGAGIFLAGYLVGRLSEK